MRKIAMQRNTSPHRSPLHAAQPGNYSYRSKRALHQPATVVPACIQRPQPRPAVCLRVRASERATATAAAGMGLFGRKKAPPPPPQPVAAPPPPPSMLEIITKMRFTSRTVGKQASKAEKQVLVEERKSKDALAKGNVDVARIHGTLCCFCVPRVVEGVCLGARGALSLDGG